MWSIACDSSEGRRARVMHALLGSAGSELVLEADAYVVVADRVSTRLLRRAIASADGRRGDILQWRRSDPGTLRRFACFSQVSIGAAVYEGPAQWRASPVVAVDDGERLSASISADWFTRFSARADRDQLTAFCSIESDGG